MGSLARKLRRQRDRLVGKPCKGPRTPIERCPAHRRRHGELSRALAIYGPAGQAKGHADHVLKALRSLLGRHGEGTR